MSSAPIICNICSIEFISRNKLFMHLRVDHDGVNTDTIVRSKPAVGSNEQLTIPIIFDDAWCRIIVKPQNLPTMGCIKKNKGKYRDQSSIIEAPTKTVLNCNELLILENCQKYQGYRKAIPCHRLDSLTGGVLVCSKSRESESVIKFCFRNKLVTKRYMAIVSGKLEQDSGEISTPIKDKPALTKFQVVTCTPSSRYKWVTTLNLWPVTGRKHQLRKHLLSIGHPILGDKKYAHSSQWPLSHDFMFLWSVEIKLPHPSHWMQFAPTLNPRSSRVKILSDDFSDDSDIQPSEVVPSISLSTEKASLDSLLEDQFIHLTIPEPAYYEEFRCQEETSYLLASNSS